MTTNNDMKREIDIAQHAYARGLRQGIQLASLPPTTLTKLLQHITLLQLKAQTDTPHITHLLKQLKTELSRQI